MEHPSQCTKHIETLFSRIQLLEEKFSKIEKTVKSCCNALFEKELFSTEDAVSIANHVEDSPVKIDADTNAENISKEQNVVGLGSNTSELHQKDEIVSSEEEEDNDSSDEEFTSDEEDDHDEDMMRDVTKMSKADNISKLGQFQIGKQVSLKILEDKNNNIGKSVASQRMHPNPLSIVSSKIENPNKSNIIVSKTTSLPRNEIINIRNSDQQLPKMGTNLATVKSAPTINLSDKMVASSQQELANPSKKIRGGGPKKPCKYCKKQTEIDALNEHYNKKHHDETKKILHCEACCYL